MANHVGVLDAGYRGELKMRFKKVGDDVYELGDKIGFINCSALIRHAARGKATAAFKLCRAAENETDSVALFAAELALAVQHGRNKLV